MCLYPRIMKNPRFKKNPRALLYLNDLRQLYVAVGCGKCYECKKQKAQQWRIRLLEEIKVQQHKYFITLTFSEQSLKDLEKECKTDEPNTIAALATRRFLERYRKKYKKSLRHWLITELGQNSTERLHIHGILMPPFEITNDWLDSIWKYGRSDTGQYCNERTINYIIKYVTKVDTKHKDYNPLIMCSPGLGSAFVNREDVKRKYKYKKGETPEDYRLNNGFRVALPIYYRNKLYTEKERLKMWTDKLDKGIRYVNGIPLENCDTLEGYNTFLEVLRNQQEWNTKIGYGKIRKDWQQEHYAAKNRPLQGRGSRFHESVDREE